MSLSLTGTVDFDLSTMPLPVNDAANCDLNQLPTADKTVSTHDLFKRKRMKGWWPSYEVDDEGNRLLNVSVWLVVYVCAVTLCVCVL